MPTPIYDPSIYAQEITIAGIRALSGTLSTNYYVTTDKGKEGSWYYDPADLSSSDDTGSVLVTADGKRIKRIFNGFVAPEFFGTIDGTNDAGYLQQAVAYGQDNSLPVQTQQNIFTLKETIVISPNAYILLGNATIMASSPFTGTEMVRISAQSNLTSIRVELNLDGNNVAGIIGVYLKDSQVTGNSYDIFVKHCDVGFYTYGNTERQNPKIHAAYCRLALKEERAPNNGNATRSPNENYYTLNGSNCDTWFHQIGECTSEVHFNVENTRTTATEYAVLLEGNYGVKLSGEIRGSNKGGIKINPLSLQPGGLVPGESYNVVFNNLICILCKSDWLIYCRNARSISGQITCEHPENGGIFIEAAESVMLTANIKSTRQRPALQLGVIGGGTVQRVLNSKIILNSYAVEAGVDSIVINNCKGVDVEAIGTWTPITISEGATITSSSIQINSEFIVRNIAFNKPTGADLPIRIHGALTSTQLQSYSYPKKGMYASMITDKNGAPAYYTGTTWLYFISAGTAGNIQFAGADGSFDYQTGFVFDKANNNLGINVASPTKNIDIAKTVLAGTGATIRLINSANNTAGNAVELTGAPSAQYATRYGTLKFGNDGNNNIDLSYFVSRADGIFELLKIFGNKTGISIVGRIQNLTDPISTQDAATKNYVDSTLVSTSDVGTSIPSTGTWAKGFRRYNSNFDGGTTNSTILWECIMGGTPGTWYAITPAMLVGNQDIEITDSTKGIILKDTTDPTKRYRIQIVSGSIQATLL